MKYAERAKEIILNNYFDYTSKVIENVKQEIPVKSYKWDNKGNLTVELEDEEVLEMSVKVKAMSVI